MMAISQCPTCRLRFGGVTGFDGHRREGSCVDPADVGMVLRNGVWRYPMSQSDRERIADLRGAT